jgi:hypothetical protein
MAIDYVVEFLGMCGAADVYVQIEFFPTDIVSNLFFFHPAISTEWIYHINM